MLTVCTAGHVNWDVTLRVDALPEPDGESTIRSRTEGGGGSAANVAAALASLDIDAVLIGSVGDDERGRRARAELEAAGVSLEGLRVVEGATTATKYLLVDDGGEVAVLGDDGVNEAVGPGDVDPSLVRRADHLHLTSQHPDAAAELAAIAVDAGATVSFDPGRRFDERDYGETIALADVVFATDREIETVLADGGEYAGTDLRDRTVVVKRGGEGAVVHTPTGSYGHPGFEVDAVDTTGAGDAFAAGFVATVLRADDVERALEYANACGALAARRAGARSGPTAEDVTDFLDAAFDAAGR
ncbi:carbohydrate kinase family protein [Natrialbaceae archaeon GCM10025810]|uniref:carbohydrate kinase family protein n=1 Tax=Halovalidus salilacus TaxID=3075124 RepID=UPI003611A4D6